jgi:hypothetical protein
LQQPFGQVVLSHTQAPRVVSQSLLGQMVHAVPPLPHCELDSDARRTHVLPLQQPPEQEAGSQTHALPLHSCPLAHVAHVAPPVPHAPLVSVMMQFPLPSQQPVEHDVASQTHCPAALHS